LVYSCCSHLEHRTSVKRFVSLQFLNLRHSVGLLGRVTSPSQGRYLTQTQNKHRQTSIPRMGFEPTIPAFDRTKTVHALDGAVTAIGVRNRTHVHIHFLLRMTDTMTSQNIDLSSWDTCMWDKTVMLNSSLVFQHLCFFVINAIS
jgi:hypothetical protein